MADFTIISGVAFFFSFRMSFSIEPLLTPTLMGTFLFLARLTISVNLCFGKFPGLILSLSTPWLRAIKAKSAEKWMSATRGILIFFFISPSALAAAKSGTPTLTISQPASSSCFICFTIFFTLEVGVLVIDCTKTGLFPPIFRLPILITLVFFLIIF